MNESGPQIEFRSKPSEFAEKAKTFERFFPEGRITEVPINKLPPEILARFVGKNKLYVVSEHYSKERFNRFLKIDHKDGDVTWVGNYHEPAPAKSNSDEEFFFLVDHKDGKETGIGTVKYYPHVNQKYYDHQPFIGNTETATDSRKQGIGMRRMLAMNALSQMEYNSPLHSGVSIEPEAESLWQKLITEGKAHILPQIPNDKFYRRERYVFNPSTEIK